EEIASELQKCGLKEGTIKKYTHDDKDNKPKLVLITGHRRENFGKGFISICEAIRELSTLFPDYDFIYPMHLNPNVRKAVRTVFDDTDVNYPQNVSFTEPLDYLPFVYLMNKSSIILTDSGGIQEEAPSLGKPVLVMRDTTERTEAIEAQTVRLVGTDKDMIIKEFQKAVIENHNPAGKIKANPYGDGKASERIVNFFRSM
ncbi:MAG TPA: UDP-N-acetylglucosamine 2-epimerase, partial [Bacteroidales bacterium]|nr:UDP-N-acetylglucosamine 2-epimerase [Bacteroidales bacterium]